MQTRERTEIVKKVMQTKLPTNKHFRTAPKLSRAATFYFWATQRTKGAHYMSNKFIKCDYSQPGLALYEHKVYNRRCNPGVVPF